MNLIFNMVVIMNQPKYFSVLLILVLFLLWLNCESKGPISAREEKLPETIRHDENITTSQVWDADKTHIISTAISIDNAVLKIKPGTTIQLETNGAIAVGNGGGLIADGSEEPPIIFNSPLAEKGAWKYIYFADKAVDDSCQLINCTIEYGGGNNAFGSVIYCDNASPTITECTISFCASTGITLAGDCRDIKLYNNTISNCDFVPIQTYACNVSSIDTNRYVDNKLNQVRIIEGNVTFDDVWHNPSVPYRMADGLRIKHAALTIKPAVQMLFEYDESATISEGGSLHAAGTSRERITFTGSDVGRWKGIIFNETANDANSKLDHCVIENGGQDNDHPANLVLDNTSPEISNCLIRQSIGYGVYISGKIQAARFVNNEITDNAFPPISVSVRGVTGLSPGTYLNNVTDVIEVRGGPGEKPITEDGYWDKLGIPYRVHGAVQIQSSTLILAPGNQIQMAERSSFEILTEGGLIADGTSEMIEITGVQSTSGVWDQIYFSSTAHASNCQLIRCQISYGGGNTNRPGVIYCDNVSPTIRNCNIEYSQTYGIYLNGNCEIADLQSNFFANNGYGNYFKTP